jgi:hypothetical protein
MILTRCGWVAEKTSMAKKRKKAAKRQLIDTRVCTQIVH